MSQILKNQFSIDVIDAWSVDRIIKSISNFDGKLGLADDKTLKIQFPDGSIVLISDYEFYEWIVNQGGEEFIHEINDNPFAIEGYFEVLEAQSGVGDESAFSAFYTRTSDDFASFSLYGSSVADDIFSQSEEYNFSINVSESYAAYLFSRVHSAVGADLPHLPGLPDEGYPNGALANRLEIQEDENFVGTAPVRLGDDTFVLQEDNPISGNVFDNDSFPTSVGSATLGRPPANGTLVFNPDEERKQIIGLLKQNGQ